MSESITYKINQPLSSAEFVDVLKRSSLGERRPIHDMDCMQGMLDNCNLLVTAYHGDKLVGVARSVTDFHYACYLSDLAVDETYQHTGIGKQLLKLSQDQLKENCQLILLAAPAANEYYPHIGFTHNPRCWVLPRSDQID